MFFRIFNTHIFRIVMSGTPTPFHLVLPRAEVKRLVQGWLDDDAPGFEIGGFVVGDEVREARILGKTPGILAGKPFAQAAFDAVGGIRVQWLLEDGDEISKQSALEKRPIAYVFGPARSLLLAERTALNILARASGIATLARSLVTIARKTGWKGHVAATRKTTPGFTMVEKYACLVGGAATHRMDLSQMCMLKDNHVWSTGSVENAVKRAKLVAGFTVKIEVEARSLEEAVEACVAGADVVMLDNMSPSRLKDEASKLKKMFPNVVVEASGGIDEKSIATYLSPAVDVVSVGKLTQGYGALDFSMKITQDVARL